MHNLVKLTGKLYRTWVLTPGDFHRTSLTGKRECVRCEIARSFYTRMKYNALTVTGSNTFSLVKGFYRSAPDWLEGTWMILDLSLRCGYVMVTLDRTIDHGCVIGGRVGEW